MIVPVSNQLFCATGDLCAGGHFGGIKKTQRRPPHIPIHGCYAPRKRDGKSEAGVPILKRRQACATRPSSLRIFKPEREVLSRGKHRVLKISRQSRLQPIECNILSVHLMRWPEIQKCLLRQA